MSDDAGLSPVETARRQLLQHLVRIGYDFVPVTPETQRRVLARPDKTEASDLRGIFGWSLPFSPAAIDPEILALLDDGELLANHSGLLVSKARVSRVRGRLFLHSPFPTKEHDSVFLGPDSWRFADFVYRQLASSPPRGRLVDIGAGAGVGGISVAAVYRDLEVVLADINPKALSFARVNAAASGARVTTLESDGLDAVEAGFDLAIANPPFIFDDDAPVYRRGGGMHGAELSRDWAIAAAAKVRPGGRILLYTGSAIVDGHDALKASLETALPPLGCRLSWSEIDPDIFGEELEKPPYRDVERIAAIGAVIEKDPE